MTDCNPNPYLDHSFDRSASHSTGNYVCRCDEYNTERIEQELFEQLNTVQHQLDVHGSFNIHDLKQLIDKANAVVWEYENK